MNVRERWPSITDDETETLSLFRRRGSHRFGADALASYLERQPTFYAARRRGAGVLSAQSSGLDHIRADTLMLNRAAYASAVGRAQTARICFGRIRRGAASAPLQPTNSWQRLETCLLKP